MNIEVTEELLNKADRIYVGRDHHCRCGCAGVYHEAGTRGFKLALNRAKKLLKEESYDDANERFVNFISGNDRAITLYFPIQTSFNID